MVKRKAKSEGIKTSTNLSEPKSNEGVINGVWIIFLASLPAALASFGNAFKPTVTILAVGQGKKDEASLAAIGLGTTFMNVILRTLVVGYNHSTVTLVSQAYGAKDYQGVRSIMRKIRIVYTYGLIPFVFLLIFIGSFLHYVGQPYKLSYDTEYFVKLSVISFFGQLHYDINRRYLNAIGMRKIQLPIPYITLALHGLWCYIFLNLMELKLEGAAIVQVLQFFMNYFISEFIIIK